MTVKASCLAEGGIRPSCVDYSRRLRTIHVTNTVLRSIKEYLFNVNKEV